MQQLRAAHVARQPFHIALLDYLMPDMDGEQLGRRIKSDPALCDTALVMMTSGSQRGDAPRFFSAGAVACLIKPVVRPSQLMDALVHAWATHKASKPANLLVAATHGERVSPAGSTHSPHAPMAKYRVLLAEDNCINQKLAVAMLQKLGCRVDVAATGQEAVAMASHLPYDIIFMDCHMPELDGYEATAAIRCWEKAQTTDRTWRRPIIAVTANAMQGDREKCLEAGMDDYISKPIRREELQRVLEQWVPGSELAGVSSHDGPLG